MDKIAAGLSQKELKTRKRERKRERIDIFAMSKIRGISHITLLCQNLEKSAQIFVGLFGGVEVYSSEKRGFSISREKFFLVGDQWFALMQGEPAQRSYRHIAFQIEEADLPFFEKEIELLGLEKVAGRPRHPQEGKSLYFYDYDNHLFELHTGNLETRLSYYKTHA
jgi:catechol 2,3-dioxygenase-like lactoylglutathione lyase family enzyme